MSPASDPKPDRWRQIEDLFHAASNCPPANRSAFLDDACGTDPELRRELESLLTILDQDQGTIESAVQDAAQSYLAKQANHPIQVGASFEQYRIVRLLGAGGMGEVYLAEDTRLKRRVALKALSPHLMLDPAALRRLEREAQIVSGLNQANLLTVFDFLHSQGRHFLVTEFVEGETVRQLMRQGSIDQEKVVDIGRQVATALNAAHASGVIHRDIKPENLMVRTSDGCVKVLDFGIATLAESPAVSTGTAATGSTRLLLGTPRYMSPEQARGSAGVDGRSDLFSFGAVLYEMLTGRPPFHGETLTDLIADILRGRPPALTGPGGGKIPKVLQTIVMKALEKEPASRYQNAADLLADLQSFQRDRELSRNPQVYWGRVAVAGLLVVLGIGMFFLMRKTPAADRPALSTAEAQLPRALAVLPFQNLKPERATDFLGFSLADEVISKLGYVKALTVRPSSSIIRYRDGNEDLHKTAAALNAGMLLTGTYLKDGDDLRITARLLGFNPDRVLWQKTLDVKYDRLLTVQDRVSNMIIEGLSLPLEPDERLHLKSDAPVNQLAYEYYLRGVDLYAISNFPSAIVMLEKSTALDPNYAPAWAYLGRAYTTNGSLRFGGRESYRKAEAAYTKSIELNPGFAEPRIYMANLFTDTGRVEESVPLLRVALQSSPNSAEAHWELGYAYRYGGLLKESIAESELARRLDPEVKINSSALNTYLYLGEYDKFLHSLPNNDSPLLVFYQGLGAYYKHQYAEAESRFDRAFEFAPEQLQAQIGKAMTDGLRHEAAAGIAQLKATERMMKERGVRDPEGMYKVAQAYSVLGDPASALRMLENTVAGGFFCYDYFARDPLLEPLHGSPGFAHFLDEARQRHDQFARRFLPAPQNN